LGLPQRWPDQASHAAEQTYRRTVAPQLESRTL